MPPAKAAEFRLELDKVSRRFGSRSIFQDLDFTVESGQTVVVTGPNGSGKSTLVKIIAGLMRPSSGTVGFLKHGAPLDIVDRRQYIGMVSPDLVLYSELTGVENLEFFARLRGVRMDKPRLAELLEMVGLKGRGRDLVGNYSSGMRQRLKYAFALSADPGVLLLDEPTANLDTAGVDIVRRIVEVNRPSHLLVIATNEPDECSWGDQVISLDPNAGAEKTL